ncbi:hypothetical protein DM01DRAFT_1285702 [Hesseltinella vesiculosa]|uniref:Uncharacterized protein n=1 Tax=Hesseltinella vesiculosa TaxID=101127 RepID=A0A1X2GKZ8_9FUNG|nr:hypothetical protein DM01DRAFT_1285702 [Hesseltinella vesiculosa]
MAIPSNPLLLSLKDFSKCNEQLSSSVRNTLLGPFQSDGKRISPQEIKIKAQQYAPLAIRIVNQNIQSLKTFKEWKRSHPGNHSSIKHCLIDTSFYATQALQQMKSFTALKPMDMEKTTSNLICKLVDLGEWARALDELRRFRCQLADLANVPLEQTLTLNLRQGTTTTNKSLNCNDSNISLPVAPKNAKDVSPSKQRRTEVIFAGGRLSTMSSTDEDMLTKYADLFTFPMEARINDKSMVLLILAYQMNAIRAWCDIHDGTLLKYLAVLLDRPGNFIDWCKSLMASDEPMAKKQLDLLQRHLFKLTAKSPSCGKCAEPPKRKKMTKDALLTNVYFTRSNTDDPLQIFALQVLALQAGCYSGAMPTSSTCDRFVRLAVGYEKSSAQGKLKKKKLGD